MTHSAPTDFYDDGLVHSHDWSRSTPPGTHHSDRHQAAGHDHEDNHADHRRVRG